MAFKNNIILDFRRVGSDKAITAGTGYPDYKIVKADGLTGLEYTFSTSTNPQVAGGRINNRRAEARNIDIELECSNQLRDHAISFFNPMFQVKLTAEWNGVKRWIYAYPKPVKVVTPNIYRKIILRIQLYCEDPMWRDMSDYGKDITFRQALLAFPFVMFADRGLISSYRVPKNVVTLDNTGDTPTPFRALFQASGDAANPRIVLNDTEYIQVNVDLHNGDTLDINTDPCDIYVLLNGRSVLNRTDKLSSYFQLPPGQNIISYQAGDEFDALSVVVYFTPRYLGV